MGGAHNLVQPTSSLGTWGPSTVVLLVYPSTWLPHPRPDTNSLQPAEPFPIQTLPPTHTSLTQLPFHLFLHLPSSQRRGTQWSQEYSLHPPTLGHSGMTHTGAAPTPTPRHSPSPVPHTQGNSLTKIHWGFAIN